MSKRRGVDERVKLEKIFKENPERFSFPTTPWNKKDELLKDLPDSTFTGVFLDGEDQGMARCFHTICQKKSFSDQDSYKINFSTKTGY